MRLSAILLLSFACVAGAAPTGHDWDRFMALAKVETGENDLAIGPCDEVSRFAILPEVWQEYTTLPLSAARNPFTALNVGEAVMRDRCAWFQTRYGRPPADREFVLLWHCPARLWHPTVNDTDYVNRYCNLLYCHGHL